MARTLVIKICRSKLFMGGLLLCFLFSLAMVTTFIVDSAGHRTVQENDKNQNDNNSAEVKLKQPVAVFQVSTTTVSFQRTSEAPKTPPAIHTLCVLVPFRNRFDELLEFVPHIHKFLNKQNVEHKLVVINQQDMYRFNRASLINAGFLETRSLCDYIAMHDVDLLPMNEALSYAFPEKGPFHVAAPHLHPVNHYKNYVGGILLLQSKHFEKVNGLSNRYWGWGQEDDEFYFRMRDAHLVIRRPGNLATGYNTFQHIHERFRRPRDQIRYFDQAEKTKRMDKETGISTIKYKVNGVSELVISEVPVTVINVSLECDLMLTPWCLQTEDHALYNQTLMLKQ